MQRYAKHYLVVLAALLCLNCGTSSRMLESVDVGEPDTVGHARSAIDRIEIRAKMVFALVDMGCNSVPPWISVGTCTEARRIRFRLRAARSALNLALDAWALAGPGDSEARENFRSVWRTQSDNSLGDIERLEAVQEAAVRRDPVDAVINTEPVYANQ